MVQYSILPLTHSTHTLPDDGRWKQNSGRQIWKYNTRISPEMLLSTHNSVVVNYLSYLSIYLCTIRNLVT
jgi:hypothetical protein